MLKRIGVILIAVVLGFGLYFGVSFALKLQRWRNIDASYAESFPSPQSLGSQVKGKRVLFHMKTGLSIDDSQICVGFNIIFAALEAGADVTILFDAGATLDLTDTRRNLASTKVPVRLKKVIAAQLNLPLETMPSNYKEYLELLHQRGAKVYANTAMNVVIGYNTKVLQGYEGYPLVSPITYAGIADLFARSEVVLTY